MIKIRLEFATKTYKRGNENVHALDNCNLEVNTGDCLSIIGPSGSGKRTLLKAISTSLQLTSGKLYIDEEDASVKSDIEKYRLRSEKIGYVVQNFILLPHETVYENIRLPLIYNKKIEKREHKQRIHRTAEILGITHLLKTKTEKLSGGESQRVAIARATCGDQEIILADEPTGALDTENREIIMNMFEILNTEYNKTVLIVTHDAYVASKCKTHYKMVDGVLHTRD